MDIITLEDIKEEEVQVSSVNKYSLCPWYVPGTVLDAWGYVSEQNKYVNH